MLDLERRHTTNDEFSSKLNVIYTKFEPNRLKISAYACKKAEKSTY